MSISKTYVILMIFLFLVLAYFVFMMYKLLIHKKTPKLDKEHFEDTKKSGMREEKDDKDGSHTETPLEKQLDMNLFVINTFEDVHDRKITTDELKKFTEAFTAGKVTSKNEMKDLIETFDQDTPPSANNVAEIIDELNKISVALTKVIGSLGQQQQLAPKPTPSIGVTKSATPTSTATAKNSKKVEAFTQRDAVLPFSTETKYMRV